MVFALIGLIILLSIVEFLFVLPVFRILMLCKASIFVIIMVGILIVLLLIGNVMLISRIIECERW